MKNTHAPTKLLFICSRNKIRSLTAQHLLADLPGFQVRSAGTENNARVRVSAGLLGWADLIFAMERRHLARLRERFPDAVQGKTIVCLHIRDEYAYMEDALWTRFGPRLQSVLRCRPPMSISSAAHFKLRACRGQTTPGRGAARPLRASGAA